MYHSPLGLFGFQQDGIAQTYLDISKMVIWDTGLGKTHLGLQLLALLAEDEALTTALLVVEKNKLGEWRDDVARFTRLTALVHHGPTRRKKLDRYLAEHGSLPQVLVSTVETLKLDTVHKQANPVTRGTSLVDEWLMGHLRPLAGGAVLVYDEIGAKLSNRSSMNYKAHHRLQAELRKLNRDLRVVGLTATPINKGYEDAYNQLRITHPDAMPLVKDFERECVKSRDIYDRPKEYDPAGIAKFVERCRPLMIRKRKTDADVVDQFPAKVEEALHVDMASDQEKLYDLVEDLGVDEHGEWDPPDGLWMTLRQLAAHPASLTHSPGRLATLLTEELGAEYLRSITSSKVDALVRYLSPVVLGQDEKAVCFSFFGQSVLPLLAAELRRAGMRVHVYHGGLSTSQRDDVRRRFRGDPSPCVFLTSDAGARGINLPESSYVIEYDSALTHAMREQRINRCSRIDGGKKLLHCMTMVLDRTVEVPIVQGVLARNEQQDRMRGDVGADGDFVSAATRGELLRISRLSRRGKRR